MELSNLLRTLLADPVTGWAIGTLGAIAEFQRDAEEPTRLFEQGAVTARGGVHLRLEASVRAIAWERPTADDSWTHGIALCLTAPESAMSARTAITELGPDRSALDESDRAEVLFDLGVGAPHCDAHVRTGDPELMALLRTSAGQSLMTSGLLDVLTAQSPTRVFASRLGRVEVRTPIPRADGKTPDGPHTHLLPDLLKLRRTHSANVPLPDGMVPCAEIYPASAILDAQGLRRAFDAAKHDAFQTLLADYGDPECMRAKRDTITAVRSGQAPVDSPTYTRAQRLARRVALRQLLQTDGPSAPLGAWRARFDRNGSAH